MKENKWTATDFIVKAPMTEREKEMALARLAQEAEQNGLAVSWVPVDSSVAGAWLGIIVAVDKDRLGVIKLETL
jgi:hypothetical protein